MFALLLTLLILDALVLSVVVLLQAGQGEGSPRSAAPAARTPCSEGARPSPS